MDVNGGVSNCESSKMDLDYLPPEQLSPRTVVVSTLEAAQEDVQAPELEGSSNIMPYDDVALGLTMNFVMIITQCIHIQMP